VVSFRIGDRKVNLIDTPGHSDFIAEVERALGMLDGVVLVVSAVEGVQAQTRRLAQAVQAAGLPFMLFVNKIDRTGARDVELLDDIRHKLRMRIVPFTCVSNIGTHVKVYPVSETDDAWQSDLLDVLTESDDALIDAYVNADGNLSAETLQSVFVSQVGCGIVAPVFFGSAKLGAGVDLLLGGIDRFLPAASAKEGDPLSGTVFKIQRDRANEKICYVRLFAGSVAVRQSIVTGRSMLDGQRGDSAARITGIESFDCGHVQKANMAVAGDIVRLHGLREARIGDFVGSEPPGGRTQHFPEPALESVVRMRDPRLAPRLHDALQQLAEQDPLILIRLEQHGGRGEISVRLYGEVQKEFIAATLANDFGLEAHFEPSQIVCIERLTGSGYAIEYMGQEGNPFVGTVGMRVDPGSLESGITFHRPSGALPLAFYKAIEDVVYETLQKGLWGWKVCDIVVTVTETAYASPVTVAADFRKLTPLVLMDALKLAGTQVCEPVHRFTLDVPENAIGEILATLSGARAIPEQTTQDRGTCQITGIIPLAGVYAFEQRLPVLSGGEGVFSDRFAGYQSVSGPIPLRPRSDLNPLYRKQYLARVSQL
ncbi:MAG: GTP-binding protein, partial [Thermomicrobiales bacterium]